MYREKIKLLETANKTAHYFRKGAEAQANESLVKTIDILQELLHKLPDEVITRINVILPEILVAQQRSDYLWAADMLEYELIGLFKNIPAEKPKHNGKR